MKNIFKILVLMILFIQGCTHCTKHSFISPEYNGDKIKSLVIICNTPLSYIRVLEDSISDRLKNKTLIIYKGTKLISPTEELTKEQMLDKIKKENIETILLIDLLSNKSTKYTSGAYTIGNYTSVSHTTEEIATYKVSLIDTTNNKNLWVAEFQLSSDDLGQTSMVKKLAKELVNTLEEEGFIKGRN